MNWHHINMHMHTTSTLNLKWMHKLNTYATPHTHISTNTHHATIYLSTDNATNLNTINIPEPPLLSFKPSLQIQSQVRARMDNTRREEDMGCQDLHCDTYAFTKCRQHHLQKRGRKGNEDYLDPFLIIAKPYSLIATLFLN